MGHSSAIRVLAGAMCLLAAGVSAGNYPAVANKPAFVAVGDGLTEAAFSNENNGWGLLMQMKYTRKVDVINRGFGGFYTTWFVDYMLDQLFDVKYPALAILFLGVKDSLTEAVTGDHYISPEQFGSNVQKIIDAAKAKGTKDFLIITPPPVCEVCKGKTPKPWDRENAHTILYVQQLQQLAQNNSAAFLDIFTPWQQDPDWDKKYLLPDKLHLSAQGNAELFNQIIKTLETQLPALAPANMAVNWPLMDVIDKENPAAAFDLVVSSRDLPAGTTSTSNVTKRGFLRGGGSQDNNVITQAPGAEQGVASGAGFRGLNSWVVLVGALFAVWQVWLLV